MKRSRHLNIFNSSLIFGIMLSLFLFSSCDFITSEKVSTDDFIGVWSLEGRDMLQDVQVEIFKNEKGELKGKIVSINENKYVKLFVEEGDNWISNISRTSNNGFNITERKVGHQLFTLYGQETSKEYRAMFLNKNTLLLGGKNLKPANAKIKYIRVE